MWVVGLGPRHSHLTVRGANHGECMVLAGIVCSWWEGTRRFVSRPVCRQVLACG